MNQARDKENSAVYVFDDYRVDTGKRVVLKRDSGPIPLKAKAFETLLYLVENPGRVVERDEILSAVWADTIVEENNLTQHISSLRRLFGEAPGDHRYIVTVPGRGYKFVADVVRTHPGDSSTPEEQENRDEDAGAGYLPAVNRPWLIVLATLTLIGIATSSYIYFRGNSTVSMETVHSIAVLPFKPITAENRDEALEMGMADTLILKLSRVERLKVRPLAAVRRYASPEQDPTDAGRQLGVEAVLDGGVQIAGGRVRISAKLIRVSDGRQLWADQFDQRLTDIFSIQDSISEKVAAALQKPLTLRNEKSGTKNVEAYQLFMKGSFHTRRLILPEVQKGIAYYEQAIAADPEYALAYVELVNAYRSMVLTNDAPPGETVEKARFAARKAVEIDPFLADGWAAQGFISFWNDFDAAAAEAHLKKALELDPENAQARFSYAHLLSNIGRHDEAIAEIRKAREIDPLSLITNALEGQILTFAGKDDEALKALQATVDMDPNFWLAHLFFARVFIKKEMYGESAAAASRAKEIANGNAEATASAAYALAKSGRPDDARMMLNELEARARTRYVPLYAIAIAQHALGDRTKTLDLLEASYKGHEPLMVFLKVEPKWDDLRSEPRFIELMRRMKFE